MSLFKADLASAAEGRLDMTLVNTLAGLGASGANKQHCHQDMLRRLPSTPMPPKYMFWVPLYHSVFGNSEKHVGIVWPHQMFARLYHSYNDSFFLHVVPSMSALAKFWEDVRGNDPF